MTERILVVEDNNDNMTLISWILEDGGYDFLGVRTAEEAMLRLDEGGFDLVLMDISLPGIDGAEATRRLRKDARFAELPIIAVTAHAVKGETEAILEAGLSDLITKKGPGANHFGTIAHTKVKLPAGRWRVVTRSDDGVRVMVDGKRIIDNWTHHGPTTNRGEFRVETTREVEIHVEHFEIDGYALLTLELQLVR